MRGSTALVALTVLSATAGRAAGTDPAVCRAGALVLAVDAEAGVSNGTSHRQGARLALRNRSAAPCRLPVLPLIGFSDGAGHPVRARRRPPPGFHPGPVMVPLTLAPAAAAEASLAWLSSPAPGAGARCFEADTVIVILPDGVLRRKLDARLCAAPGAAPWFDQAPFASGR